MPLILLLLSAVPSTPGGAWFPMGGEYLGQPSVRTLDYTESGMSVELIVPGFYTLPCEGYTRIQLPGWEWDTDLPPGSPELPVVPVLVGLPSGTAPEMVSIEADWTPVGTVAVYPVQPLSMDGAGSMDFTGLSPELAGLQPESPAVLSECRTLFGVNTARLMFRPFRWNPESGLLEAASSVSVAMAFTGSALPRPSLRPETATMLESLILNFGLMGLPVDPSPVAQDEVVYIVITIEQNLPEITPLLEMVNLLGHRVSIAVLPEGSTPAQIRSEITARYQPGVTRFVLIAAKHQELPSFNYGSFYGDYYYQTLDGDNLPDIAVGRLPAGEGHLANMVAKSMAYCTYTGAPGEPSIPATTMLCAHEEEYPYKYTQNKNAIKDWNYVLMDPVFDTFYPPEGATLEQVQERINAGVGTVNYRGHGSVTTWTWAPGWNAGAIYALTNTFFPPVFNIACDNGAHDKTYNCLAESWLYAEGRGASGTCGASAPSATTVNHRFDRVIYWQLYDVGNTCVAEMHAAAQTDIVIQFGASGLSNARMYHWFGDPSMDVFNCAEDGSPFPLQITCPSHAFHGENTITVTASSQGLPVEGAVITVTDGIGNHPDDPETFYAQAVTDASGEALLSFTAQGGSELRVGARLHNLAPAFDTIQTWPEGVEEEEESPGTVLHPVIPNPATRVVGIRADIQTTGSYTVLVADLAGRVVDTVASGLMETGSHRFDYSAEDLAPGLYFVLLRGEGLSVSTRMMVVGR